MIYMVGQEGPKRRKADSPEATGSEIEKARIGRRKVKREEEGEEGALRRKEPQGGKESFSCPYPGASGYNYTIRVIRTKGHRQPLLPCLWFI